MGKRRTSSSSSAVDSERLLGIEEAEVNGYLNTQKEMLYKTMIWEMMNKDYAKAKTPKQAKTGKEKEEKKRKDATNKRVASEKLENERRKKRLGSKVNLDVLKKLMHDDQPERELAPDPEKSVTVETQCCEGGDDDELEQYENEYNEDFDHGNENVDYENDCNYEEDFDYEDY